MAQDFEIVFSPAAAAQLAQIATCDPAAGEKIKEMLANMRQAHQAVQEGRYASFEDALEAITGERPVPVTEV